MKKIICEEKINELLQKAKESSKEVRWHAIEKARKLKGLTLAEAASLLYAKEADELTFLYEVADEVKREIYGDRVVMFAPLYTSNECTNNCLYCGFRAENDQLTRKTLKTSEIIGEAQEIVNQGHKRLLLVCGEDKAKTSLQHTIDATRAIYEKTDIRRINVNTAPMDVAEFQELKKANIGTYQLFQETYHRATYQRMHPTGSKSDYDYRLTALDRAIEAGIDDFGIGVLLGLYEYKFDVLASLMHADYLDTTYNIGPHTVSIPRLKPALGSALLETPHAVSDEELRKVVAIYRLTLPYTGIILSTRESDVLRDELLKLGVSQMSAGSKTNPGGYENVMTNGNQFETSDERTVDEMVQTICAKGYLPSFCTACYREDRTGEHFMELAKAGHIQTFCQPNSIFTFQEYIEEFAPQELKADYQKMVDREIEKIDDDRLRKLTKERVEQIKNGERDLYL